MRHPYLGGGVLLLGLVAAGGALAQASQAQRAACTPDVFRLCSGDIPNVTRITSCLRAQRASLSPGCTAVFDAVDGVSRQAATRSLTSRPVPPSGWCEFGENPVPGQDVWIAWCQEMGFAN